jgi:type II restriction/modification system DNA methylase subunit YeeA
MNTNKLKKYAQEARRDLIRQVGARYKVIRDASSIEARENPEAIRRLEEDVKKESEEIVIERVAYTWFNRIVALRYMDANNYSKIGIVSPKASSLQAEILVDAREGHFDADLIGQEKQERVLNLLTGKLISRNPQQEAYRILLASACNYYHQKLPFLFERITDYIELLLPEDLLSDNSFINKTVQTLTDEDCSQVEVIGWLYQFYISEKKDQAMAKKKAYQTSEIPAVTQLFTPHWIVQYMVENSLGRLWMENHPDSRLKDDMSYYIEPEAYENKLEIKSPQEIKFIDPCCGSGHILVYAFDLLSKIYEEEGYNKADIPQLILDNNLVGIDIDRRAGELASLALTMKARSYFSRYFRKEVVVPKIIIMDKCQLDEVQVAEMLDFVGKDKLGQDAINLEEALKVLSQADSLGSLIQPKITDLRKLKESLAKAKLDQHAIFQDSYSKLQVPLEQIEVLQAKYHCVVTNPPYMGSGGMNDQLKSFVKKNFKDSKSDLMATFMERGLKLNLNNGFLSMINQHSWMFLSSYEKLRSKLIKNNYIESLLHLGTRTFPEIGGEVVQNVAFTLRNIKSINKGIYLRLTDFGHSNLKSNNTLEAISNPDCGWYYTAKQEDFKKIPGSPIAYWVSDKVRDIFANNPKLGDVVESREGMATAGNDKFLRFWNEVEINKIGFNVSNLSEAKNSNLKWFPYIKGGEFRKWYGNHEYVVDWENDGYNIKNNINMSTKKVRSHSYNGDYSFKSGLTWSDVTSGLSSFRFVKKGFLFDATGPSAFISDYEQILQLLAYLNNKFTSKTTRILNPTLHFKLGNFRSLPYVEYFLSQKKYNINNIVDDNINISNKEWDSRETSWDFTQNPLLQVKREEIKMKNGNSEQIHNYQLRQAYNLWVKQSRESFFKLHANEEDLNQIFLDIYDLNDEMDKYVDLEDITLFKNEKSILTFDQAREKDIVIDDDSLDQAELRQEKLVIFNREEAMKQFISYAVGCMFGRYTLDKEGLFIANQGQTIDQARQEAGLSELTYAISETNVIPVLGGQWFGDDIVERFKDFLKVSFGNESFTENLAFVEESLGKDIEKYLVKDFYDDHIKRYKKRPIYWLFSSAKKGFSALIYMHRYSKDTASIVLNNYLREYISKLDKQKDHYTELSLNPSLKGPQQTKALKELDKLRKLITELNDYEKDILFPLANKHIEIDLDDGVLVNYNKFGKALKKF